MFYVSAFALIYLAWQEISKSFKQEMPLQIDCWKRLVDISNLVIGLEHSVVSWSGFVDFHHPMNRERVHLENLLFSLTPADSWTVL